ncbi:MAG: carboxypeptidase regulatory-like domain-containing protein [Planctomycetes bacterium]|nr:carboxypeptidase regulatory-like domain-containing protein [Planctomycetota bacterium]
MKDKKPSGRGGGAVSALAAGSCSLLLALLFGAGPPSRGQEGGGSAPPAKKGRGGEVHGSVYADFGKAGAVPLPGFAVSLRDAEGRVVTARTDAQGRFLFRRQPPGKYRLALAPGWATPDSVAVEVGAATAYVPPLAVRPRLSDVKDSPQGMLRGHVRLDGGSPWFADEFFGVMQTAAVSVTGEGVARRAVLANARGEFVVVGLPRADLVVTARLVQRRRGEEYGWTDWRPLDKGRLASTKVSRERFDKEGVADLSPLVLPDRRPEFVSVTATVNDEKVDSVRPGTTVICPVRMSEASGKDIQFTWKVPGYNKTSNENTFTWKVPERQGMQSVYVLASSNQGGFALGHVRFAIADKAVPGAAPGPLPPETNKDSFLTRKQPGSAAIATNYYQAVDPQKKRETLGAWWTVNGFNPKNGTAKGEKHAAYLNDNDLGSGRDMHILKVGANVAGYVTNYGNFDQDPLNADLAEAAKVETSGATVCMEYSPIEGKARAQGPIVKFFVYETGDPKAKRLLAADLDGNGPKFVPNLCLNCHGGDYSVPDQEIPAFEDINMGASFREFDLTTYKFPRPNTPKNNPARAKPSVAEQQVFKELNDLIDESKPTKAIRDLLAGWYPNKKPPQDPTWSPPGWNDKTEPKKKQLYDTVVAKSCRTCHVALAEGRNWTTFDQFQQYRLFIKGDVCNEPSSMPHAKVTFKNFWSGAPSRADELKKFEVPGWPAIGKCP